MLRIVADLGNSRLKWARVDEDGNLTPSIALPLDDPLAWDAVWDDWQARASASPRTGRSLRSTRRSRNIWPSSSSDGSVSHVTWYRTAADVPIAMDVEGADTGGADRALAVLAALRQHAARPSRTGRLVRHGDHDRAGHRRGRLARRRDRPGPLPQRPRPSPADRATAPDPSRPVGPLLGPRHPRLARGRASSGAPSAPCAS